MGNLFIILPYMDGPVVPVAFVLFLASRFAKEMNILFALVFSST